MQNLEQIVYISRAQFPISTNKYILEPEVQAILAVARSKNRLHKLVGVLCFGDGYFLQCLQGEQITLDRLYENLLRDSRHTDIKLLSTMPINELTFAKWSMKFVGVGSEMREMLAAKGHQLFEPHRFSEETINNVIWNLIEAEQSA
ncbi:MAG: BLUF domain-containing protein [Methylophilaceae bacterium]